MCSDDVRKFSKPSTEDDEYTQFGHIVSTQLRTMPLRNFLVLQQKIQNLIAEERIKLLEDGPSSSSRHSEKWPYCSSEESRQIRKAKTPRSLESMRCQPCGKLCSCTLDLDDGSGEKNRLCCICRNLPVAKWGSPIKYEWCKHQLCEYIVT